MVEWKRICCPVDFSEASRGAMRVAADLARRHGSELFLLHVYQLPGAAFPEATLYAGQQEMQRFVDFINENLAAWRKEALEAGAPEVSTKAVSGVPYAEIVEFAQSNACDLIVMGTHGRTALMRVLLGSVAERVVRHAVCPVLTVRPTQTLEAKAGTEAPSPR